MLNEQRRFDLQVADLIVNLDTDTVTEFNEENKPNDEKENEFYEVDLTSNTSSAPTLNPNVSNSSSNSQFRIGRHKSSKNIKWKGVKSNITSLPKDVATRLKQRYFLLPSHTITISPPFLNIGFWSSHSSSVFFY